MVYTQIFQRCANGMFLFQLCYIFSSVWMSEGNIPIDYEFLETSVGNVIRFKKKQCHSLHFCLLDRPVL